MFAGITLQEGIVFEIFKNRTVLRDLLLVIVALALQFIQLLVELPYLDQVIFVENRYQQDKDNDRDHPQPAVFQEFVYGEIHCPDFS